MIYKIYDCNCTLAMRKREGAWGRFLYNDNTIAHFAMFDTFLFISG